MIGDDVEIIIVDVRGDKVRLGITAPKEIPVHRRREKRQKKETQEKESQTPQPSQESHQQRSE